MTPFQDALSMLLIEDYLNEMIARVVKEVRSEREKK